MESRVAWLQHDVNAPSSLSNNQCSFYRVKGRNSDKLPCHLAQTLAAVRQLPVR